MKFIKPMLASRGNVSDLERKRYIFEPMHDGVRVIVYKYKSSLKIFDSVGKNITRLFPELLSLSKYVDVKECVLDCEIVIYSKGRPDFQKLKERFLLKRKEIAKISKDIPAVLVVKDILYKNGKNLRNLSLMKRKEVLENTVAETNLSEVVFYSDHGKKLWKQMLEKGFRGVIAKYKSGKYVSGKTVSSWLCVGL
ncbi:MAG: hypothetical protein U9R08_02635 [Nanoarchaeota archaeon]|nr:hypothetical protein [Nanoarchaeota archaeon]